MLRKSLSLLACLLILHGFAPVLSAQTPAASTATITGVILNPAEQPAFGFRVVVRDVASDTQFISEPTDASGNYTLEVPLGGRYKIESVIADDGVTRLPVLEVPPVSVLTAGTTSLNVRFTSGTVAPATAAAGDDRDRRKGSVPWYKTPGGITGIVIGSAVVLGLAIGAGGGGDDPPVASASTPE